MMRLAYILLPLAIACSSDTTTPTPDAKPVSTVDAPAGPDAGAMVTLTLNNFDFWCAVTEEGSAAQATTQYPMGKVVHLTGAPVSATFVWGYWSGTDGGANDTKQSTTVTMTSNKTVLACCPFATSPDTPCQ